MCIEIDCLSSYQLYALCCIHERDDRKGEINGFYNPHMTAHHVWHENDVFLVPSFSLHFQKMFFLSTSFFG